MLMGSTVGSMLIGLTASLAAVPQTSVPKKPTASAAPSWEVVCPEATAGTQPQPCSLIQNLVAGEQKQRLLTVIVQRTATGAHGMTLALPHGVLFTRGITLQIDDAPTTTVAVETSDQNGAYAGTAIDAAMLTALSAGKTLKVGFNATNGQNIIVPVTLKDFGPGLKELDKKPLPAAPATKS